MSRHDEKSLPFDLALAPSEKEKPMTNTEKCRKVAEWLEWRVAKIQTGVGEGYYCWFDRNQHEVKTTSGWSHLKKDVLGYPPTFSDPNSCRLFEEEAQRRGLGREYSAALMPLAYSENDWTLLPPERIAWIALMTTSQQRLDAICRVIEAEKKS